MNDWSTVFVSKQTDGKREEEASERESHWEPTGNPQETGWMPRPKKKNLESLSNLVAESPEHRDLVLDAVEACFLRHGVRKTTVEDVAREAKMSRMTVYRLFKSREELFQSVIFRHAERFTADVAAHLVQFSTVDEKLLEGIVYALRELPQGPLHSILFGSDAALMTTRFAITSENLLQLGSYVLEPMLAPARAQGRLRAGVKREQVQEWLVRVILSFLMVPVAGNWDEIAIRHMVRSFLLPSVLKEDAIKTDLCHTGSAS